MKEKIKIISEGPQNPPTKPLSGKVKVITNEQPINAPTKYLSGKDEIIEQPTKQPLKKVGKSSQIPSELKDVEGVRKFQDWLDSNHAGWAKGYEGGILNKGISRGGYGKFGPRTIKAWNTPTYKNDYLKTSNSGEESNSGSISNWQDTFPSCIKGLKGFYSPPNNYFLGFGTDTEGVQYLIAYFSKELNQGRLCNIFKMDKTLVGNGYYSCTTNNQQITIKTLSGLSITGSVVYPDSKDIASYKKDDEKLAPSDDDVLDDKIRVSKNVEI
jgi:hypothetical protein